MYETAGERHLGYDISDFDVLIVDDNEFSLKTLRAILTSLGVRRITISSDGAEAYDTLNRSPFDLIITNWNMKPVDGVAFVKRVRRGTEDTNASAYIPIIMLTAHTEIHNVFVARDAGVSEFLAKPISPAQLFQRIIRLIEDNRDFIKSKGYFGPDRRRVKPTAASNEGRRKEDKGADDGEKIANEIMARDNSEQSPESSS